MVLLSVSAVFIVLIYEPWKSEYERSYDRLLNKCNSCENASALAEKDFFANTYQIIEWGYLTDDSDAVRLYKNFGIKTFSGGCIPNNELECYNKKMKLMLFEKFGMDTLNKTIKHRWFFYNEDSTISIK